jgi:RNA polymerase sigma factor (sigma-70 family)
MYHQNISWWRKRRFTETSLGAYDAAHSSPDSDLRLTLDAALAQLTAKQRTILVLRFFEDLTEVQTADAVGVSVGTVKSTTRHALARLRVLAPDLDDLVGVGT